MFEINFMEDYALSISLIQCIVLSPECDLSESHYAAEAPIPVTQVCIIF